MADNYQSSYTGGQLDAAVRAIGMAPSVYVTYTSYTSTINKINQVVESASQQVDENTTTVNDWNSKLTKFLSTWDGSTPINELINQAIQDEFKTLPYVVYEKLD